MSTRNSKEDIKGFKIIKGYYGKYYYLTMAFVKIPKNSEIYKNTRDQFRTNKMEIINIANYNESHVYRPIYHDVYKSDIVYKIGSKHTNVIDRTKEYGEGLYFYTDVREAWSKLTLLQRAYYAISK